MVQSSALLHHDKIERVTQSPLRPRAVMTLRADVSPSVIEKMGAATHSYLGFFAGKTVASAIPSAVFPWRCCADLERAAA